VNAFDFVFKLRAGDQAHGHMDPADDQDVVFGLDFAGYLRSELAVAGIDLARIQRTSKRAAPPNVPSIQPAVAEMT
jgi:hypothetical protein